MGHAESPSLISLGLAADVSPDPSSFRWGIATSCLLHALFIAMALFLRFHSPPQEPLRAIDVAIISLSEAPTTVQNREKSSPPAASAPRTQQNKPQPLKSEVKPAPEVLPPLPTQTASERLSDFLGGAIGSIVVPERQTANQVTPSQMVEPSPSKSQKPLIENLVLPSSVPQLSRPERLSAAEPVTIPRPEPALSRKSAESMTATSEPQKAVASSPPVTVEAAIKPAPALPELSQVTPFKHTETETRRDDNTPSKNLEESFKRSLPTVPAPTPPPKIHRKSRSNPAQSKKSSLPDISAPELTKIQPSEPMERMPSRKDPSPPPRDTLHQRKEDPSPAVVQEPVPQREKMSKMMEQLLGEVKVPTLQPQPSTSSSPQVGSSPPSPPPAQSEMDHRIAKLSIPSVTPVESIKKRLQLLEVQSAADSGNASSQPSLGTNKYLGLVQDLIQDQWRKTPLVANAPVVVLKFRISRSGEISQILIDESSGNEYYDSAARRAVHAVNPLPPFPPEMSEFSLPVRFLFIKTDNKH